MSIRVPLQERVRNLEDFPHWKPEGVKRLKKGGGYEKPSTHTDGKSHAMTHSQQCGHHHIRLLKQTIYRYKSIIGEKNFTLFLPSI